MCGIVGIVSRKPEFIIDPSSIRKMGEAVIHRGPDDEGYFVRPQVALGNRRLSIIDLESGKQPISTQDKRYTIVFNGEIFNYKTLKKELVSKGVLFRTESDTEVVLNGFAKDGIQFLDRLDGMFSFLLFDALENKLFAARDAFGIKPLFLFHTQEFVAFSSEIKSFSSLKSVPWQMNEEAVSSYFSIGYSIGRGTFFKGIHKLPPGTLFTLSMEGGEITEEVFVQRLFPPTLALQSRIPRDVEKTLIQAIEQSMVSDVPVGLYLSGGIDSSYIASVVSKELGKKLKSFSIAFSDDPSHNEFRFAQEVAKALDLEHFSYSFHAEELKDFRKLVRALEEPLTDPSAAALLKLSHFAKSHVKVVLSGEGGDELFGGYHRYFWDRFSDQLSHAPWSLRKLLIGIGKLAPQKNIRRRVQKLSETLDLQRHHRWMKWFSPFQMTEHPFLGSPHLEEKTIKMFQGAFDFSSDLSFTPQAQWVDLVTYLRDDLLVKADKMSMAEGLEVRVPFLQADVVTAAFSLSDTLRTSTKTTKPFLRTLLSKYLPPSITKRKKQGFEMPLDRWFRGPLQSVLSEQLSKEKILDQKLLNWATVEKILKEHESGKANRGLALFSLCTFSAWCDEFL